MASVPATGQIVAGACAADGSFIDARKAMRSGELDKPRPGENTTIGVVASNAKLIKAQAKKMAAMAQAILRGVGEATSLPGYPAVRDLGRR